jgi:hypothetical protein
MIGLLLCSKGYKVPTLTIIGTLSGGDHVKRNWELDELIEHFTILERNEVDRKKRGKPELDLRCYSSFFKTRLVFQRIRFKVPKAVIAYIAKRFFPILNCMPDTIGLVVRSLTIEHRSVSSLVSARIR